MRTGFEDIGQVMNIVPTNLTGVCVLEPHVYCDTRGFFMETFSKRHWLSSGLPDAEFVQDNHSKSAKGVLRGIHFQNPMSQGKLVRVISGAVFDAVVDTRKGSPSFGQSFALELSEVNKMQLWVPAGLAHGFLALEDDTEFLFRCTNYYEPEYDHCLLWSDPALGIQWPRLDVDFQVSEKYMQGNLLSDVSSFPTYGDIV